jgi:hypothetical protein
MVKTDSAKPCFNGIHNLQNLGLINHEFAEPRFNKNQNSQNPYSAKRKIGEVAYPLIALISLCGMGIVIRHSHLPFFPGSVNKLDK